MQSVMVAYSGGVDSSLVAWMAHAVLGERLLSVTVRSPVESPEETRKAIELAELVGFRHEVIDIHELENPRFAANPPDRCYLCKLMRFQALHTLSASQSPTPILVDGSNADDMGDYRPGMRALAELGVRSPLREAGLTKAEVRTLSYSLGLPNWDKPAAPCLATRFPYGTRLVTKAIQKVGEAEAYLYALGLHAVRVRVHGDLARIEVQPTEFSTVLEQRQQIAGHLRQLGYAYVALDLLGYRTGSMNEVLDLDDNKEQYLRG